jgi:hypothetical protein
MLDRSALYPAAHDADAQFALRQAQALPLPIVVLVLTKQWEEASRDFTQALNQIGIDTVQDWHTVREMVMAVYPLSDRSLAAMSHCPEGAVARLLPLPLTSLR